MTRADAALLVGAASSVSLALVGAYLAAGGASYSRRRPRTPASTRPSGSRQGRCLQGSWVFAGA